MNIASDSSLGRSLNVHVVYILLNQGGTFFMSIEDMTIIGIQEGIQ